MAHTFNWYVADRVGHVVMHTEATLEDVQQVSEQFMRVLDAHHKSAHEIITMESMTHLRMNALQIKKAAPYISHPHMGWVVVYGKLSAPVRFMTMFITQLAGVRVKIVENFDQAVEFLKEQDQTIDWATVTVQNKL